jgi:hypothetical protein
VDPSASRMEDEPESARDALLLTTYSLLTEVFDY